MLNERRLEACKRMGFSFYRGQMWFNRVALDWLTNVCPLVSLTFQGGYWSVGGLSQSGYFAPPERATTFEETLITAVLSV